jgi:SAM-dependent methyltransferase
MASEREAHWEQVYRSRQDTEVSWYAPHLTASLRLIREVTTSESSIIDVGGGASTLVDDLLEAGYRRIAVLDISGTALARARARLGEAGGRVSWICGDVTAAELPAAGFDLWHDRAVFHFLTAPADREAYRRALLRSLRPGGQVVIGTFSLSGPQRCSGLEVMRYDAAGLQRALGEQFSLRASEESVHVTPAGNEQSFVLCRFQRAGG